MLKNKLVKEAEAAEYLGLSARTLGKARSTGSPAIPFKRIGSACRYSITELDAYLAQNSFNSIDKENADASKQ